MQSLTETSKAHSRTTVFVTHAAPEDNEFALWISSKLATAGYRVWVDQRRLRGGDDFWDEIDRVLRNSAIKQVVAFTRYISKAGVKKELAIGDIVKARLNDGIPIRADDIAFGDAPPEFIRTDILNAYPNWHDCLKQLFEALEDAHVPKEPQPNAAVLRAIIDARVHGRRFVVERPEAVLTNWFVLTLPKRIRYYQFEGIQDQVTAWLAACREPHVSTLRLAGSFLDPAAFAMASSFCQTTPTVYDVLLADFIDATDLGPYTERSAASNDVANLLRQHFASVARAARQIG